MRHRVQSGFAHRLGRSRQLVPGLVREQRDEDIRARRQQPWRPRPGHRCPCRSFRRRRCGAARGSLRRMSSCLRTCYRNSAVRFLRNEQQRRSSSSNSQGDSAAAASRRHRPSSRSGARTSSWRIGVAHHPCTIGAGERVAVKAGGSRASPPACPEVPTVLVQAPPVTQVEAVGEDQVSVADAAVGISAGATENSHRQHAILRKISLKIAPAPMMPSLKRHAVQARRSAAAASHTDSGHHRHCR